MNTIKILLNMPVTLISKNHPTKGKTIIYPKPSQPIDIYASPYCRQVASEQRPNEIPENLKFDEYFFEDLKASNLHSLDLDFILTILEVNSCTGLPILNDAIDVSGNIYGLHDRESCPLRVS